MVQYKDMKRHYSAEIDLGKITMGVGGIVALGGLALESAAPAVGQLVTLMGAGAVAVGAAVVGMDKLAR